MLEHFIVYGVAFLASLALILLFRKPAVYFGLVDYPGGRKMHGTAVPVVGGVAIFCAFAVTALMLGKLGVSHASLIAALLLLVGVGIADDLHDLSARSRFIAQIVAAVFMTSWGGLYVSNLGDLFGAGSVNLHDWSIPFTVFGVIGLINALNMTDGIDGLAGGLSLLALAFFSCVALLVGMLLQFSLLIILLGGVAGFLVFNFRHPWRKEAAIFLGDAGSMMLGFVLAWFAVELTQGPQSSMTPITAVWVMAVPLLDTVSIMIRRVLHGRNPFAADREHLHHLLLRSGCPVDRAVRIILALAVMLGAVGIAGWYLHVPEAVMFYAFIGIFVVYYYLLDSAWRKLLAS